MRPLSYVLESSQKVIFPLRLDISSVCTEALKKQIGEHRDAVDAKADAQREANEAKLLESNETEEKDDAMKVDAKEDKSKPRKQTNPCMITLSRIYLILNVSSSFSGRER